jgi:TolB-like protein
MHIGKKSSSDDKKYPPDSFMGRLKERKIIATLAAFAGSGVVIIELAHHILVNHYHFPHQVVDFCIVTIAGTLIATLIWRWFRGTEKRPGNVKVEVLVVPLTILLIVVIDLKLIFAMTGIAINMLPIGIVALCLGIAWVVFKSLQWAASVPEAEKKVKTTKPGEEEPISFPEWEKSIVVLPFENISPEEGQDYFCDGLTEEIITDLSKIHKLRVISRNSVMVYKDTRKSTKEIAQELSVQYILEGSVRKSGNDLRITAQLIDAEKDSHIWAEKYQSALDDIFTLQEKVSLSIIDILKLKLSPEEDQNIKQRPIKDIVVYECYLRAKQKMPLWTEDAIDSAIALLKKALEIEGPNELLYTTLGLAYTRYWGALPFRQDESELEKAEDYAAKVFEMNPDSSDGHVLKGTALFFRGMLQEAVAHIKMGYRMDPNNSNALFYLAWISGISGQMDKCRSYYEKLIVLDPWTGLNPGWLEYYSGNFEKSIDGYRKEYEMNPESPYTRWAYACTLAWALHKDEACEILDKIVRDTPNTIFGQYAAFLMNALQGHTEKALRTVTPELISAAKVHWQLPWMMAAIYSLLGRTDESLNWLEHAVTHGFINYPFLSEKEPFLENVRGVGRYKKIMEKTKHEWENFEV